MAHRLDSRWTPVWFLAPAVIALFAIGIFPTLYALWNSLHQVILPKIPREGTPFVGLGNYLAVLTDPTFWDALIRTLLFLVIVLPAELLLGLAVALLLHKPGLPFLKTLARLSLVIPMATTYAVVGLIGRLIFNRDFGVVNWFLGLVGIVATVLLGGMLAFSSGLLVVAAVTGRAIGLALQLGGRDAIPARTRVLLAIGLAVAVVGLGQVARWVYAGTEGGVLSPPDYLGQTYGVLVPLQFVLAAVFAWWAAR